MTSLVASILTLLLAQPPGVAACSSEDACYALAHDIGDACERAGDATGIDPWLLAAIAHAETRFDASRDGTLGRGLFGLNPRGRSYREAAMLCHLSPRSCTLAEAFMSGAYLAEETRRCGGTEGALQSYGTGRCDGKSRYPRTVRASLARLRGAL